MNVRSSVLILTLFLLLASCEKKPQQEPSPSILDQICEVESTRHGDRRSEGLVFINNQFMDAYATQKIKPDELVSIALSQKEVCSAALFQLLGRYHADYIVHHHDHLFTLLNEQAWQHILFGLKSSKEPIDMALKLKMVSPPHPASVRIQGIRWAGPDLTESGCESLPASFWVERNPTLIQEWLPHMSPLSCPRLVSWVKELMPILDVGLHQSLLLTIGQHEFEARDSLIEEYKQHPIKEIQKMAESLEFTLSQSSSLKMEYRISTNVASDFGLNAAVEEKSFEKIIQAFEFGADLNTPVATYPSLLMFLIADSRALFAPPSSASFQDYRSAKEDYDRKVLELVQYLLKKGANANIQDRMGRSLLFHTVMSHRNDLVATLLTFGADPYLANGDGVTPIGLARMMENTQAIQLIKEWDKDGD